MEHEYFMISLQSFSIENLALGFLGIVVIMGFIAVSRIMRTGRKSFDTRHNDMDARIKDTAQSIRDNSNAIQSHEQLHIIASALKDALEQKGHMAKDIVSEHKDHIKLNLNNMLITIRYQTKVTTLHSIKKKVYGQGLWEVSSDDNPPQSFANLMLLEKHLLNMLHDEGY